MGVGPKEPDEAKARSRHLSLSAGQNGGRGKTGHGNGQGRRVEMREQSKRPALERGRENYSAFGTGASPHACVATCATRP